MPDPERYKIMKPGIRSVLEMTADMGVPVRKCQVRRLIKIMTGPVDTRKYKMGVKRSTIFPFRRVKG